MAVSKHGTGELISKDGLKLHYENWVPEQHKAAVIYVHGMGEHVGRYTNPVDYFGARGYSSWGMDHRGHGRSEGPRGHVMAFGKFVRDLKDFVELVAHKEDARSIFMAGHSLGGLIAATYAVKNPKGLKGLILSAPALKLRVKVPAWKTFLGRVFAVLLPQLTMNNELDPEGLSHDQGVVKAYIDDPLVHSRVSARLYVEMLDAMTSAVAGADRLSVPLFLIQGDADPIVDPEGGRRFFENAAVEDKLMKLYDGFFHEPFNEIGKERVFQDLEQWMEARL